MYTCGMDAKTERSSRDQVNRDLVPVNREYHDGLPLARIDEILKAHGFNELEDAIYCGRDGVVREQVGGRTWLMLSWHKTEGTGRYEIVAYVS